MAVKSQKSSPEHRYGQYQEIVTKMKQEAKTEKCTGLVTATKPYSPLGDQNTFDIDKELGPTIDDWEVARYYKINRTMPGQKLFKAEKEDIALLSPSKWKYFNPTESFEGVTYRLVRLTDAVSSPLLRVKTNMRAGVRPEGRSRILVVGIVVASACSALAIWQLHRISWKRDLIALRRNRVTSPLVSFHEAPLPWVEDLDSWAYRQVQLRGVIDSRTGILVGPRDCPNKPEKTGFKTGFLVFHTLRLQDGTELLVNRGHMDIDDFRHFENAELCQWITIRGIINPGEQPGILRSFFGRLSEPFVQAPGRLRDRIFTFVEPKKMAAAAELTNLKVSGAAVIDILEILYDEDLKKLPGHRPLRNTAYLLTKKSDFYQFWCSEHTHFNYAMQWFLFAGFAFLTTFVKWIDVHHWKF